MQKQKRHDFGGIMQHRTRVLLWACDHDDRQPKIARREDFSECCLAAAVLGHDRVDRFLAEEPFLRFNGEWASSKNHPMARQAWCRLKWLDRPDKIEMLGFGREGFDLQSADCQKNAFWFLPESGGGGASYLQRRSNGRRLRDATQGATDKRAECLHTPPPGPHAATSAQQKDAWHRQARQCTQP